MTVAPGTSAVALPAYSAPTFTASKVAVGAAVADITIQSTSTSAQTNVPFTMGHVFKQGDIAPTDFLVGRSNGKPDVPLQFNVKATHPDGSVRHAVISGVLPSLAASEALSISMVRVSSNPVSASAGSSTTLTAAGFSATLSLVISGTTYTASPTAALGSGMAPSSVWIGGSVATEWTMMLPLVDGSGNAHPLITAQFNVRHYPGAARAKVDVTIEHTKAYAVSDDVSYNATLTVGGATAYTYSGVTHFAGCRFYRSVWWGAQPLLHIRHNSAYLTATKQVPNYDLSVVMQESTLNDYVSQMTDTVKFGPMGAGPYAPYMAGTGGRPDIGLNPAWAAATVISMDKRAKDLTLAGAACGGSWGCHRRDTSEGPGKGYPLSVVNWPSATCLGGVGDGQNYNTGQNEKIPGATGNNPNVEDNAHTPNFSYLAYLLTGDLFYLEEVLFYTTWVEYFENPYYRQHEKGVLDSVPMGQIRGQGWALRALADAAAIAPDTHYLKPHFIYWLDNTLAAHNTLLTDNPNSNQLGINDTYFPYEMAATGPRTGQALWQDDHFTSAVGHVNELGFTEAGRLLRWKAKFQIGRLLHPDWCYQDAALYNISVRSADGAPTFNTWVEVKQATIGTFEEGRGYFDAATAAAPCGSQQRLDAMNASRAMPSDPIIPGQITGYAQYPDGFVANFQPALAMAVDSGYTDGDLAWDLFDSRTVKPDYGLSPQFAIVPRGEASTVPTDPTDNPDTPTQGNSMKRANRVCETTTGTSTSIITLLGKTTGRRAFADGFPVGRDGIKATIEDAAGNFLDGVFKLTSANTLTRTAILDSSNNGADVTLAAGVKLVQHDFFAEDFENIASTESTSASTVSDVAAVKLLLNDAGNVTQVPLSAIGADVTSLPAATSIGDSDTVLIIQGGNLKLLAASIMKAYNNNGATTPSDTTAPTLSSPTAASTGTTTASGSVTTNEGNGTLRFLATVNATETVATVKASTSSQAVTSAGSIAVSVTGLTAATQYYLHFVHTDAAGNDSAAANSAAFTTATAGDTTAPTLSSPTGTQTGSTTATGSVSTNEANGILYRYISTNAVESSATVKAANLTQSVTATGVKNVSATGLTASTTYYWHFVHRDTAGNDSTVANSAGFTTAAAQTGPTPVAYQFNGPAFIALPTTLSFGGTDLTNANADFIIKTAAGAAPDDTTADVYASMATSSTVMPRPNDAEHASQPANTFKACGRIGAGDANYNGYYSYSSLYTYRSFGGGLANRYMWIMVFAKGADPATATPIFAAPYDGNHTGAPIAITMSA